MKREKYRFFMASALCFAAPLFSAVVEQTDIHPGQNTSINSPWISNPFFSFDANINEPKEVHDDHLLLIDVDNHYSDAVFNNNTLDFQSAWNTPFAFKAIAPKTSDSFAVNFDAADMDNDEDILEATNFESPTLLSENKIYLTDSYTESLTTMGAIPEPSVIALASLSGMGLLIFRRLLPKHS